MKRMAAVLGLVVVAAIGGVLGQASGAQAQQATTSDKTLYAGSNLVFSSAALAPANGTPTTLVRIRVTAPTGGTAVVSFDSQWWTDFPGNGGSSALFATGELGRCSASNTLSSSVCNGIQTYYQQKAPYNTTGSDTTAPFSIQALIPFAHGGTKTLSLNVAASGYPTGFYDGAHTQVEFTPSHPIATSSHVGLSVFQ